MAEELESKLAKVRSLLLVVTGDLSNPEGSVIESDMQNVIELAIEQLNNALELTNNL